MRISETDILETDGSPAPFSFVGGVVNIDIDDSCCKLTLTHEYLHYGKYPTTILVVTNLEGWELLSWTASSAGNKIKSSVAPQMKTLLNPPGIMTAQLPYRLHPLSTLLVKCVLFKQIQSDETRNSIDIQRILWGRSRGELSDWKRKFHFTPSISCQRQLAVNIKIRTTSEIKSIDVPMLKNARISKVDNTATIAWKKDIPFDEDIRLDFDTSQSDNILSLEVVKADSPDIDDRERYALSLSIYPTVENLKQLGLDDTDLSIANSEFIFLIDVSGSMHSHIATVINAAIYGLLSLPPSVYFNIILFGGGTEADQSLNPSPVKCTNETIEQGIEMLKNIVVRQTNTDILPSLSQVYEAELTRGYTRQVILFTNSGTDNSREALQVARDHSNTSRIMSIGIAPCTDAEFVRSIAAISNGKSFIVDPSELVQTTIAVIKEASKPCLTNVTIDFSLEGTGMAGDVDDSLSHIRKCFSSIAVPFIGQRQVLSAFAGEQLAGNTVVTLSALLGDQEVCVSTHVQPLVEENRKLRVVAGPPLEQSTHISAALQRVRTLVEPAWGWKYSKNNKSVFCGKTSLSQRESDEIIRLSSAFGFVTPLTVMIPTGDGINDDKQILTAEYNYSLPQDTRMLRMTGRLPTKATPHLNKSIDGCLLPADFVPAVAAPKPLKPTALMKELVTEIIDGVCGPPDLDKIFKQQRADGSWGCTQQTARLLGVNYRALRDSAPDAEQLPLWVSVCTVSLLDTCQHMDTTLLSAIIRKAGYFIKSGPNHSEKALAFMKDNSIHYPTDGGVAADEAS
eukprot:TRINITY_DN15398_c0_g1_i1.p1 TRINITY_DN15398_c0_g1~~TRINITY_DN15398_c0_g1_i1.p1  ORF type:complete len:794 (+),score=129.76 TRINITY_DN15398_c0_g1_i1:47-2428(+)